MPWLPYACKRFPLEEGVVASLTGMDVTVR